MAWPSLFFCVSILSLLCAGSNHGLLGPALSTVQSSPSLRCWEQRVRAASPRRGQGSILSCLVCWEQPAWGLCPSRSRHSFNSSPAVVLGVTIRIPRAASWPRFQPSPACRCWEQPIPLNGENNQRVSILSRFGAGSNGKGRRWGFRRNRFNPLPLGAGSNDCPKSRSTGITCFNPLPLAVLGATITYTRWSSIQSGFNPLLYQVLGATVPGLWPCRESVSILSRLRCWEQREFSADDEPDNEFQSSPCLGAGTKALFGCVLPYIRCFNPLPA